MIPEVVPPEPAAGRERGLHADPQRGVRDRVRAARPARHQPRRPAGGHPHRRRPVLPGGGLLLHAPAIAATGPPPRSRATRRAAAPGKRLATTRSPVRAKASASSAATAPSAGRCCTSGSRRRSSACSACSVRDFAEQGLGLAPKDFAVIVLPLGGGIVMGILLLNAYGKYLPRRRVIEGGLITLGVMLGMLSVAGPISRLLQRADEASRLVDLSAVTSLLADRRGHRVHRGHRLRRSSRSRRRPSSRRTCPRRSAAASSAS